MSSGLRSTHVGKMFTDPVMTYTPDGLATTKFTLPINTWNSRTKAKGETLWLQVTTFGKTAESVNMYCHAGTIISVTGDVQIGIYVGKDQKGNPLHKVNIQMVPTIVDYIDNYGSKEETIDGNVEDYKF